MLSGKKHGKIVAPEIIAIECEGRRVKRSEYILNGMNEICAYVGGYSAPTVLKWIRHGKFPAWQERKGGVWRSDTRAIDDWNYCKAKERPRRSRDISPVT